MQSNESHALSAAQLFLPLARANPDYARFNARSAQRLNRKKMGDANLVTGRLNAASHGWPPKAAPMNTRRKDDDHD